MTKNGNRHGELSAWARKAGISPAYAYEIETNKKVPPLHTALRIFAVCGKRFGLLANSNVNERDIRGAVRILKVNGQLAA